MYYILTEDAHDKSGFRFYELLNNLFLDCKYTIISASDILENTKSSGNQQLKKALELCITKSYFVAGDMLIVAFDKQVAALLNENKRTVYETQVKIKRLQQEVTYLIKYLQQRGVLCYMTQYICFEELFITSNIHTFFNLRKEVLAVREDYIRNCMHLSQNINKRRLAFLQRNKKYVGTTIEQALAWILSESTFDNTCKHFRINKKKFGDCWFKDCNNVVCYRKCVVQNKLGNFANKRAKQLLYNGEKLCGFINWLKEKC